MAFNKVADPGEKNPELTIIPDYRVLQKRFHQIVNAIAGISAEKIPSKGVLPL